MHRSADLRENGTGEVPCRDLGNDCICTLPGGCLAFAQGEVNDREVLLDDRCVALRVHARVEKLNDRGIGDAMSVQQNVDILEKGDVVAKAEKLTARGRGIPGVVG